MVGVCNSHLELCCEMFQNNYAVNILLVFNLGLGPGFLLNFVAYTCNSVCLNLEVMVMVMMSVIINFSKMLVCITII